jgi:hypothetical protein
MVKYTFDKYLISIGQDAEKRVTISIDDHPAWDGPSFADNPHGMTVTVDVDGDDKSYFNITRRDDGSLKVRVTETVPFHGEPDPEPAKKKSRPFLTEPFPTDPPTDWREAEIEAMNLDAWD